MLKGYENITYELTDEELKLVDSIIKGLEARVGKENAVTNKEIQKAMDLSSARVHKIIQYIRQNNLIYGICSSGNGYYIAKNLQELDECLISLKQRIYTQMKTLHCLENQNRMFGGTGQLTIFE
tara:strand:+ start:1038 stop:1409 length:372 start_codon:yes stop_codon:yes gene_type:complete